VGASHKTNPDDGGLQRSHDESFPKSIYRSRVLGYMSGEAGVKGRDRLVVVQCQKDLYQGTPSRRAVKGGLERIGFSRCGSAGAAGAAEAASFSPPGRHR
jgi:hypothetical protein